MSKVANSAMHSALPPDICVAQEQFVSGPHNGSDHVRFVYDGRSLSSKYVAVRAAWVYTYMYRMGLKNKLQAQTEMPACHT